MLTSSNGGHTKQVVAFKRFKHCVPLTLSSVVGIVRITSSIVLTPRSPQDLQPASSLQLLRAYKQRNVEANALAARIRAMVVDGWCPTTHVASHIGQAYTSHYYRDKQMPANVCDSTLVSSATRQCEHDIGISGDQRLDWQA